MANIRIRPRYIYKYYFLPNRSHVNFNSVTIVNQDKHYTMLLIVFDLALLFSFIENSYKVYILTNNYPQKSSCSKMVERRHQDY